MKEKIIRILGEFNDKYPFFGELAIFILCILGLPLIGIVFVIFSIFQVIVFLLDLIKAVWSILKILALNLFRLDV